MKEHIANKQRQVVQQLLEGETYDYGFRYDTVEVACALINLGIARAAGDRTIVLRSHIKAWRFLNN